MRVVVRGFLHEAERSSGAGFGAFLGLGLVGFLGSLGLRAFDGTFLIGSLGATAVILFGAPDSPMARPRCVLVGHLVSAAIGVTAFELLGNVPFFAGALAVGVSIIAMSGLRALHAPGGATALIACIGPEKVKALGYGYVVSPVLTGVLVMLVVAGATRVVSRAVRSWAAREDGHDDDVEAIEAEAPLP